jgi:hypothetical protein
MDAAAIHVGTGTLEEEAWAVGYQIDRAFKTGNVLALEFDADQSPSAELFDTLLDHLLEAQARGMIIEIRNMPSWLRFALETPEGKPPLACAG